LAENIQPKLEHGGLDNSKFNVEVVETSSPLTPNNDPFFKNALSLNRPPKNSGLGLITMSDPVHHKRQVALGRSNGQRQFSQQEEDLAPQEGFEVMDYRRADTPGKMNGRDGRSTRN
jgi:hypothetical protein